MVDALNAWHTVRCKQLHLPFSITLFSHPTEMMIFCASDTVVPLNSLWDRLQLTRECWVVETSRHCMCGSVCVGVREREKDGRGGCWTARTWYYDSFISGPLEVLQCRGSLINLAFAWHLALLYLWSSAHHCVHTHVVLASIIDTRAKTYAQGYRFIMYAQTHLKAPVCMQT